MFRILRIPLLSSKPQQAFHPLHQPQTQFTNDIHKNRISIENFISFRPSDIVFGLQSHKGVEHFDNFVN